jgi:hypothetical protein
LLLYARWQLQVLATVAVMCGSMAFRSDTTVKMWRSLRQTQHQLLAGLQRWPY